MRRHVDMQSDVPLLEKKFHTTATIHLNEGAGLR